jgi:hypothetical protein
MDVTNTPSMSDLSVMIVMISNRPNQRLNVGQFEAISSVVVLGTSGTRTGGKLSRGVKNSNLNAIIGRNLKKENCDHATITGCGTAN